LTTEQQQEARRVRLERVALYVWRTTTTRETSWVIACVSPRRKGEEMCVMKIIARSMTQSLPLLGILATPSLALGPARFLKDNQHPRSGQEEWSVPLPLLGRADDVID
jgi:hypothetical protein